MSQLRVLLIDDDQEVLAAMSKFLQRRGFHVACADTAATAMANLGNRSETVDLVIADLALPPLAGLGPVHAIQEALPEVPVILLGGHGDFERAAEAQYLGAFELVHKPLDGEALLAAIDRAMARRSAAALTGAAAVPGDREDG